MGIRCKWKKGLTNSATTQVYFVMAFDLSKKGTKMLLKRKFNIPSSPNEKLRTSETIETLLLYIPHTIHNPTIPQSSSLLHSIQQPPYPHAGDVDPPPLHSGLAETWFFSARADFVGNLSRKERGEVVVLDWGKWWKWWAGSGGGGWLWLWGWGWWV